MLATAGKPRVTRVEPSAAPTLLVVSVVLRPRHPQCLPGESMLRLEPQPHLPSRSERPAAPDPRSGAIGPLEPENRPLPPRNGTTPAGCEFPPVKSGFALEMLV